MLASAGRTALTLGAIGAALGISASLYSHSRSADFDRHAEAVAAIGRIRQLDEHLSELVLAARFGLLNQYDSLTSTERWLGEAPGDLRAKIEAAVAIDPELDGALVAVEDAITKQQRRVERFEAENAVLKNSLHYLPTAAEDAGLALREAGGKDRSTASVLIPRLVQGVLVHDLIGDQSTRETSAVTLAELEAQKDVVPEKARSALATLLSHARVITRTEDAVDGWVKQVFESGDRQRISAVDAAYHRRFAESVASSNRYRRILYGWSLMLLAAASVAGLQLRRIYANLERLVGLRTAELRSALDALWGEMRLASKIQQALVPKSLDLEHCEIAATMKAVESVGGDYYDLVHTREADWVLIGDVSGHGVPAGLIMMMCHTAVRTLLRSDPTIMPDRLLVAVNGVLTENIRQLGEDRYMTISAFRHERDGTVFFSGAHQDIQIRRAGTNAIETIETHGLWLGLSPEIGDKMATSRFELAAGDLLLLYTDGVTEAVHDGRMFDTDGVQRVLRECGNETAEQVLAAIFDALGEYTVSDDATVLAIRRCA